MTRSPKIECTCGYYGLWDRANCPECGAFHYLASAAARKEAPVPKDKRAGWLRDIEPGDVVYIRGSSRYGALLQRVQVVRVTPTGQFVTKGGSRYNHRGESSRDGTGQFVRSRIVEPTPEVQERYALQSICRKLNGKAETLQELCKRPPSHVTLEALEALNAAFTAFEETLTDAR